MARTRPVSIPAFTPQCKALCQASFPYGGNVKTARAGLPAPPSHAPRPRALRPRPHPAATGASSSGTSLYPPIATFSGPASHPSPVEPASVRAKHPPVSTYQTSSPPCRTAAAGNAGGWSPGNPALAWVPGPGGRGQVRRQACTEAGSTTTKDVPDDEPQGPASASCVLLACAPARANALGRRRAAGAGAPPAAMLRA